MKKLIMFMLAAALVLAGCGTTGSDKIVMTVSEYEELKAQAEKGAETAQEAPTSDEKEESEEIPAEEEKAAETSDHAADLIGEWSGEFAEVDSDENFKEVETGKILNAFLEVRSDNTWNAIVDDSVLNGRWEPYTESGNIISLIIFSKTEEGGEYDAEWTFGYRSGLYVFSLGHGYHYDVYMTKQ